MGKEISVRLNPRSINTAIKELERYKNINKKLNELCRRLAEMGAVQISLEYARAAYTGDKDISVSVEPTGNGYSIIAGGESVLFVEFGSGVTHGYGHPDPMGFGPGTYPPTNPARPRWNDPNGWYLPKDAGGGHTFGNPPSATMFRAAQDLRNAVQRVAQEVFNT